MFKLLFKALKNDSGFEFFAIDVDLNEKVEKRIDLPIIFSYVGRKGTDDVVALWQKTDVFDDSSKWLIREAGASWSTKFGCFRIAIKLVRFVVSEQLLR